MGFIRMVLGDVSCFDGDVWGGGVIWYGRLHVPSVATMTYIGTHAVKKEDKEIKPCMRELAHFLSPHSSSNSILLPEIGRL